MYSKMVQIFGKKEPASDWDNWRQRLKEVGSAGKEHIERDVTIFSHVSQFPKLTP